MSEAKEISAVEAEPHNNSVSSASVAGSEHEIQDEQKEGNLAPVKSAAPSEPEYPSFKRTFTILVGLYLAIFLVALDRTILGTVSRPLCWT